MRRGDFKPPGSRLGSLASTGRASYAAFMRLTVIAVIFAVSLAACNRSQPALDAPSPSSVSAQPDTSRPPDPSSTGSLAPASSAQAPEVACSREVAAQFVRAENSMQASNDPCVVYWRSMEVRQHPERSSYLECNGLKAYPDPQPRGHPVSLADCDRRLRERQARMGVPVVGMTDEQKATYRATWGK
jgi:hypothetical protein